MELKSISATRLRIWKTCEFRYKLNYHSDLPKPTYEHNKLGLVVHSMAKEIDERLSKGNRFPKKEDYEWAKKEFAKISVSNHLADAEYLELGLNMALEKLDNFDPTEKIIALEQRFPPDLKFYGVPVLGAFDKVLEVDKNTLAIIDYKTSRMAMTPAEARDDIQMSFYDLASRLIYPNYPNIILIWDYLRPNLKQVKITTSAREREFFSLFVESLVDELKAAELDKLKPTMNRYCGWCEFKYHCPAYTTYLESMSKKNFKPADLLTDEELVQEWENMGIWKKIQDGRERELQMTLHDRIQESGKNVTAGDKMIFSVQNSNVNFNIKELSELLSLDDLVHLVRANKSAIDKFIASHPEQSDAIMKLSEISYSNPFFRVKKIKKANKKEEALDAEFTN